MTEIIKTIQINKKIYRRRERASQTLALSFSLIISLTIFLFIALKIILNFFEFKYKVLKTLADILNRKKKERIKKCQSIVMIKRMIVYLHLKGS